MNQIRLGRSNLQVSRIAFGAWELGGDWGATHPRHVDDAIAAADLKLDEQAMRRIDEIVAAEIPVGGPSSETV